MKDIRDQYAVLDIEQGASNETVKHARMFYVQVFHPDRLAYNPSLQKEAEEKLKKVNAAYDAIVKDMLQKPESRPAQSAGTNGASCSQRPAGQTRRPGQQYRQEEPRSSGKNSSEGSTESNNSAKEQKRNSEPRQKESTTTQRPTGLFSGIGFMFRIFVLGIVIGMPTAQLAAEAYYAGTPSLERSAAIYTGHFTILKEFMVTNGKAGYAYAQQQISGKAAVKAGRKKEGNDQPRKTSSKAKVD